MTVTGTIHGKIGIRMVMVVRCVARNSAARAVICNVMTPNRPAQIRALTAMIAC